MEGQYTKEQVDQMIADAVKKREGEQEAGIQLTLTEKKNAEALISEGAKVMNDASHLLEIEKSNPELAKKVLDTYFGGISMEDAKAKLGITSTEDIVERVITKRQITETVADFKEKIGLDPTLEQAFDNAFQKFVGDTTPTKEQIGRYIKYAYLEVDPSVQNLSDITTKIKTLSVGGVGGGQNDADATRTEPKESKTSLQKQAKELIEKQFGKKK